MSGLIDRCDYSFSLCFSAIGSLSSNVAVNPLTSAKPTTNRHHHLRNFTSSQSANAINKPQSMNNETINTLSTSGESPAPTCSHNLSNSNSFGVFSKILASREDTLMTIAEKPSKEEEGGDDGNESNNNTAERPRKGSSLSQAAREKRSALREYKSRVDSLEEESKLHKMYCEQYTTRHISELHNQAKKDKGY